MAFFLSAFGTKFFGKTFYLVPSIDKKIKPRENFSPQNGILPIGERDFGAFYAKRNAVSDIYRGFSDKFPFFG